MNITGWLSTDVTNNLSCPRCGQLATFYCRTPKGHKCQFPHVERMELATQEMKNASKLGSKFHKCTSP